MDLSRNEEKLRIIGSGAIEEEQVAARLMEWQQKQTGTPYMKVMTDEQMELLRKQISIYATICERLVEMHKAMTSQQDFAGMRLGNVYCDTLTTSTGHKLSTRQRWTPTPMQLQALEHIFEQGTGTPSKQKIKDITNQLIQHGPISETNVYNWFQNRRARSKRKQNGAGNSAESEVETEVESPRVKRAKSENEVLFQNSERSSELDPDNGKGEGDATFPSDGCFYDGVLSVSNPRIDHLMGKMEVPGSYYGYE